MKDFLLKLLTYSHHCNKQLILIFTLLVSLTACKSSSDFQPDLQRHPFDPEVMSRLSRYDSLRKLLLAHFETLQSDTSMFAATYGLSLDTSRQNTNAEAELPTGIKEEILPLARRIGGRNLFGFALQRDSSIRFLIRNTYLDKYHLDVRERLTWYPDTSRILRVQFPMKDTLLTGNWQYMLWYDKRTNFSD